MGRPRDLDAKDRILASTFDLVATPGADASINAIVAHAGVGKATVYRWWGSRTAVVLDALTERLGEPPEPEWTADAMADLRSRLEDAAAPFITEVAPLARDLLGAALTGSPEAADVRETLIGRPVANLREAVRRAIASDALRQDTDPDTLMAILEGALLFHCVADERPAQRLIDGLMATVERCWAAAPS